MRKNTAILLALLLTVLLLAPVIASAEKNVKYVYEKRNEKQHAYVRHWDIYDGYNRFVKHESKVQYNENHTFNSNKKCTKCGYQWVCPHSSTTQISSDVKTLPFNGTYHSTSGTVTVRCNQCGNTFTRNVDGKKEAHKFNGGRCACGFTLSEAKPAATKKPACTHTYRDSVLNTRYEKRDKTYHTVYELIQHKCSKCGDAKTEEKSGVKPHTIKGSACTACGEQLGCAHDKSHDECTVIAALDNKNGTHDLQKMVMTSCDACGLVLESQLTSLTQSHTYVGGICVVCGAAFARPVSIDIDIDIALIEVNELFVLEAMFIENSFAEFSDVSGGSRGARLDGDAAAVLEDPPVNGFIFSELDHPFYVDDIYILREGEEAGLYVLLIDGGGLGDGVDAVTSATPEDITWDMIADYEMTKLDPALFPGWEATGSVSVLNDSIVTAEAEGKGVVTMPADNEFSFLTIWDTSRVMVVPADDPRFLFIENESFGQGMLPLLETEDGILLVSVDNLYYDASQGCVKGRVVSRLPISLGILSYIGMEECLATVFAADAPWHGVQPASLVGKAGQPIDLSAFDYHFWEEGGEGIGMPLAIPLEGVQMFEVVLPWASSVALCETTVNIAGTLLTAIPEVMALLSDHGLDAASAVNANVAAVSLFQALEARFGQESFESEDSPLRGVVRAFYQGETDKVLAALDSPEASRQLQLAAAAGTPSGHFLRLQTLLEEECGIQLPDLLRDSAAPGAEAFWRALDALLPLQAAPMSFTMEEIDAVLAALAAAQIVDTTWGMGGLLTGFVGEEIYDALLE